LILIQLNFFAFIFSPYPHSLHSRWRSFTSKPMTVVPQKTRQFNPVIYISSSRPTKYPFLSPLTFQYIPFFSIFFKSEKLTGIIIVLFPLLFLPFAVLNSHLFQPSHLLQCAVHKPVFKAIRIPLAMLCSFMDERSVFGTRVKAVKGNPCSCSLHYLFSHMHYILMYPSVHTFL